MKDILNLPNGVPIVDQTTGIIYEMGEFITASSRIARSPKYVGMWVIIRESNQKEFEVVD